MDIREVGDEDLLEENIGKKIERDDILLGEADEEILIGALRDLGIDARPIDKFSDTELNTEVTRRYHEAQKRYEEMMAQGLV